MRWAVGITTAPRPEPTLERTLDSVARAGWPNPTIFAEPASPLPPAFAHLRRIVHPGSLGPYPNFLRALATLVETDRQAEAYAVFQDDIELSRGLRAWLDAHLWPKAPERLGVVSLYCAAHHAAQSPGWHALDARDLPRKAYGALAYVFTPLAARRLALSITRSPRDASPKIKWDGYKTRTDFWVGKWCKSAGLDYLQHSPSFVRHIGATSSIPQRAQVLTSAAHEAEFRQCRQWVRAVSHDGFEVGFEVAGWSSEQALGSAPATTLEHDPQQSS